MARQWENRTYYRMYKRLSVAGIAALIFLAGGCTFKMKSVM